MIILKPVGKYLTIMIHMKMKSLDVMLEENGEVTLSQNFNYGKVESLNIALAIMYSSLVPFLLMRILWP